MRKANPIRPTACVKKSIASAHAIQRASIAEYDDSSPKEEYLPSLPVSGIQSRLVIHRKSR